MKQYEASARTVEEAIEQGLQELGVAIGDVDVQVVEEGSKGLFGFFGSRPAKVRLTVKATEEDPLGNLIAEDAPKAKPTEKKVPEKKPEKKQEAKPSAKAEPRPVKAGEAEPRSEKAEKAESRPEKAEKADPRPEKANKAAKPVKAVKGSPAGSAAEAEAPETEGAPTEQPAPARVLEKPEVTMIPDDQLEADSPAGTAKAFLKELTRLMGVDVTIDMGTDAEGNVYGYINGDTLGILIGRRGETLDAVQYLTSLKVNHGKDSYTRVTLDTENYRAKREDTLIRLANRMANRAVRTGRKVSLEPMNPYERRIIHFALQQNDAVATHSEGDEPNRHVVITVKK